MSQPDTNEGKSSIADYQAIATPADLTAFRDGHLLHLFGKLAAVTMVGIVIGVAALLFGQASRLSDGPSVGTVGAPVTRYVQAGGLEFSMRVTPGPYFVSELFVADLSLTNHTKKDFELAGPANAGPCGSALYMEMTGGTGRQYTLPVSTTHSCPFMTTHLKADQTITVHQFTALSSSGKITLQVGADFLQTITTPDGNTSTTNGTSPLDGQWPAIQITVDTHIPVDRKLALQNAGQQVTITAPIATRGHLYYIYNVSCDALQGGTVGTGNYTWEHITLDALHEPDCGDYGKSNVHWFYAVGTPGYAIAASQNP